MKEDFPDPGGPCNKYPLRYGIPVIIQRGSISIGVRKKEKKFVD